MASGINRTLLSTAQDSISSTTSSSQQTTTLSTSLANLAPTPSHINQAQLLTPVELEGFPGANAAARVLEQDKATIALYNELAKPRSTSSPFSDTPQIQGILPQLRNGDPSEQAAEARFRFKDTTNPIRIQHLNLSGLGLTCVPAEISLLESMQRGPRGEGSISLDLSHNQLTSFPENLPNIIGVINLSHNQIVSSEESMVIPSAIHRVNLSHNQLSSFSKIVWANDNGSSNRQPEKYLNISYNQIDALPIDMSNLDYVVSLDLSYNRVKELPERITLPKNLCELLLPFNLVESLPQDMSLSYAKAEDDGMGRRSINLTENPVDTLEGVTLGSNLSISVGAQWSYDQNSYLEIFEGTWMPDRDMIRDPLKGPRVGATTPGPYLRPLQILDGNNRERGVYKPIITSENSR